MVDAWKDLFFRNKSFLDHYFKYLKKYSDKEYVKNFFLRNENIINKKLGIIFNDYPEYIFFTESYFHNAKIISNTLINNETITMVMGHLKSYGDSLNPQYCEFQLKNNTYLPFEIIDITYKNIPITIEKPIFLDGKKDESPLLIMNISFNIPTKYQTKFKISKKVLKDFMLRYRALGTSDTITTKIYSYPLN